MIATIAERFFNDLMKTRLKQPPRRRQRGQSESNASARAVYVFIHWLCRSQQNNNVKLLNYVQMVRLWKTCTHDG